MRKSPDTKVRPNSCQPDLITEARAGLIPACDDIADEIRARANQTLLIVGFAKSCAGLGRHVSDDILVTELFTHLRRYCHWKGIAYEKLNQAAIERYSEEASEEWRVVIDSMRGI